MCVRHTRRLVFTESTLVLPCAPRDIPFLPASVTGSPRALSETVRVTAHLGNAHLVDACVVCFFFGICEFLIREFDGGNQASLEKEKERERHPSEHTAALKFPFEHSWLTSSRFSCVHVCVCVLGTPPPAASPLATMLIKICLLQKMASHLQCCICHFANLCIMTNG